jgi:hypothetical protein
MEIIRSVVHLNLTIKIEGMKEKILPKSAGL